MRKEAVKEAATLEEARLAAAQELGVAPEEAQYEVLQEPQKKVLGLFGGTPARVRAYVEITAASVAEQYLREVLTGMGVQDVSITAREEENGCVLTLEGEDLGFIIGRRGETLDALQYLTGLVANRVDNAYYRVTLDIGNYREKREQALSGLARKIAGQAARTGRRTSLEPMNPYERRIIHTAVQEIKGAVSWSVGSEPNRHVIIGPSEDNPNKGRSPRSGRRGGSRPARENSEAVAAEAPGDEAAKEPRDTAEMRENRAPRAPRENREPRRDRGPRENGTSRVGTVAPDRPARQVREFVPRSNPLPTADGATPPSKTQSEKESTATLYGRIDL